MKLSLTKNRHVIEKSLIIILVTLFTVFLIFALFNQPVHNNELQLLALSHLDETGVSNIVTAVLLNYRAYDTFIEFAVFLCVAIAVLPYMLDTPILTAKLQEESQVLLIAKVFIPLTIIMAGYLLWIGSSKPGGAFQASALLAGCLVLLSLANVQVINFTKLRYRLLMSSGLIAFITSIVLLYLHSSSFIAFPVELAGAVILAIEFFATFAIALILFLCFESINKGHA
jgi:multisubunit Na+/H+ antiporter MnhB subunit